MADLVIVNLSATGVESNFENFLHKLIPLKRVPKESLLLKNSRESRILSLDSGEFRAT